MSEKHKPSWNVDASRSRFVTTIVNCKKQTVKKYVQIAYIFNYLLQWTANHEGLTCDQYAAWIEDNDPERSVSAIQQHLRDNGLECPRCHFKYSLSR